ncbi:hypothetical protein [Streptomyces sp. NRRL S-1813]|uniref:hypothetical protein n=1 Tax=Streptomyces sp. NRRL S-1813 TaxID=1463888 RepID=UPI0004CBA177|nr:hypothetical protein [Streptomyces sp. NRRL S-1813]
MPSDAEFADALLDEASRQAARDPSVRRSDWRTGTVTAVDVAPGTVDVDSVRARRLESYVGPRVGDRVIISQSGMGNWVALGRTASASAALGLPRFVYKAANTDRASTTIRTADPDLTMTLDGSAVYVVEFHLFVGGPASGLMVTSWIAPSGASGLKGAHGAASTAAGVDSLTNAGDNISGRFGSHGFATSVTYGRRDSNTNLLYAVETGTVFTTSSGTCAISWAQSASNATATRMGLGSWMRATRIA